LGKDSIRYYDEVEVDLQVFKNLKIFKKEPKNKGDDIFDRLTTSTLNKHLSSYMQGLTAKVFRTYNASWTMATLLKDMKATGTIPEKMKQYNDANRKVAILCNHKRTVGASHESQMGKLQEKINALRYQQWRIRMQMIDVEPKLKKKRGAEYFERPEDLTSEWVQAHQAADIEEKRQKITKKFEKENEKLIAEGKKAQPDKELKERLGEAAELEKKYKKENKTGKVEAEGKGPSIEKLDAAYEKLDQRIEAMKLQAEDKEDNKEIALGTSKIVSCSKIFSSLHNTDGHRTTLILASPSSSARNSMFQLSASSPRPCVRSLTGPFVPLMRAGTSKEFTIGLRACCLTNPT